MISLGEVNNLDVVPSESPAGNKKPSTRLGFRIWLRDLDSTAQLNALQRGPEGVSEANNLGLSSW